MKYNYNRTIHIPGASPDIFRPMSDAYIEYCKELRSIAWQNYDSWKDLKSFEKRSFLLSLVHSTRDNPSPRYGKIDKRFHDLPMGFRRSAIADALADTESYAKTLKAWEAEEPEKRGKKPRFTLERNQLPYLYYDMFKLYKKDADIRADALKAGAGVKQKAMDIGKDGRYYGAFRLLLPDGTWIWKSLPLRQADVNRLLREGIDIEALGAPRLVQHYHDISIHFGLEEKVILPEEADIICAIDIGIRNQMTLSIIEVATGRVIARKVIHDYENERKLNETLAAIREAQKNGAVDCSCMWRIAEAYSRQIMIHCVSQAVKFAKKYKAKVIVMEKLEFSGKIKLGKKYRQRVHLWPAQDIEKRMMDRSHAEEIRFARVPARGTSSLAYNGTGKVSRDKSNSTIARFKDKDNPERIVEYNANIMATYNIGARYIIYRILDGLTKKERGRIEELMPELKSLEKGCAGESWTYDTYTRLLSNLENPITSISLKYKENLDDLENN